MLQLILQWLTGGPRDEYISYAAMLDIDRRVRGVERLRMHSTDGLR